MNIMEHLTPHIKRASRRQEVVQSIKAKADAKRSVAERFADWMTAKFGSIWFLSLNTLFFLGWMAINLSWTPLKPFDPFPFELLTTAVSLEAIFLAIIVLISQNRESRIADIREEVDLQVNTMAEEEVSKMLELLAQVLKKQGVDLSKDEQLKKMIAQGTPEIERQVEKELSSDQ